MPELLAETHLVILLIAGGVSSDSVACLHRLSSALVTWEKWPEQILKAACIPGCTLHGSALSCWGGNAKPCLFSLNCNGGRELQSQQGTEELRGCSNCAP